MKYLDIIDPIHRFVRVTPQEQQIIDHPHFQRLRRIKQLSLAYLVYPGAQHTRFEHSLGVLHITSLVADRLAEQNFIDESSALDLRIASLLHDIGHGPFSHTFESIDGTSHEEMTRKIILQTEIGDILEKNSFDKKHISKLAIGKSSKHKFLNQVMSGFLSSDSMDYLLRDSYYTGVEHARVDYTRITHSMSVYKNQLALDSSALYSLESMLHSRYQMFRAVYFHKTIRAAEVMLLRAIQLVQNYLQLDNITLNEYISLDDQSLLSKLLSVQDSESRQARYLIKSFMDRRLVKLVKEYSEEPRDMNIMRQTLASRYKLSSDDIFIDYSTAPAISSSPSKADYIVLLTKGKPTQTRVADLVPQSMNKSIDLLRVYISMENRQKLKL